MTAHKFAIGRAWSIFAMLAPIYLISMFQRMAPAVIAPDMAADFGVNVSDLAIMSGAAFMSYGLMQLPSGLMADSIGGKKTVAIISLLGGLGSIGFALSPNLACATLARVFIGLGCAVMVPCLKILAEIFPQNATAKIYGVFLAIGLSGSIFAGSPTGALSEIISWRLIMIFCGIICISLTALVYFCVPAGDARQRAEKKLSLRERLIPLKDGLKHVFSEKSFWPLCLWFSLLGGFSFAFSGLWWGPYMMYECGLTKAQAGFVISLAFFVNLPGPPLLAAISDKIRSRKLVIIACGVMCFGSTLIMALLGPAMTFSMFIIYALFFGLVTSSGSVAFTSTRESFSISMAGTALGIVQTLPYLLVTPLMQKIFGILVDSSMAAGADIQSAYGSAIWSFVICAALIFTLAFFVKETFPKTTNTE